MCKQELTMDHSYLPDKASMLERMVSGSSTSFLREMTYILGILCAHPSLQSSKLGLIEILMQ